jgi:DNA-directed RNA polymerase
MTIPGAIANGGEPLLTQEEVELRMYYGGVSRATNMMSRAEEGGRAVQNPYAREILDEYVMPLANVINTELSQRRVGVRQAHAVLLGGLDPEAVAALAIRTAINCILRDPKGSNLRGVGFEIGRTVHNELVLNQIADSAPGLFHILSSDFNRRMSKDERHRMTVFKMQARDAGINVIEWPLGARDQVGIYLLGLIEALGMIEIDAPHIVRQKVAKRPVALHPDLMERIQQIKGYVSITMPTYGPCVAPPHDWTTPTDGGFHTPQLRRAHGTLVRHRMSRSDYVAQAQMPVVLAAVNTLQRTAWQVNTEVLEAVLSVAKHFAAGEIASPHALPKPDVPEWLNDTATKEAREAWTDDRKGRFKAWKRQMAEWHTARKLAGASFARFYAATRGAEMFKAYPALYFTYFADSRGRLYPMTYGLNPQGSDLQRGLIRFAKGLPLNDSTAVMWFCVQGANKFGFDKATLEERQQWVMDRANLIEAFAEAPLDNRGWKEAADPVQFLAWCFEFRRWRTTPDSFVSHLPISMDGSCNGLQNLSALLRDHIGGQATNLTNNSVMQDIYRQVAEAATERLKTTSFDEATSEALRLKWLSHGINRTVVKRSVMTTPYGVTRGSAADYVVDDYLKPGSAGSIFQPAEYSKAAQVLMSAVWPAIGDVVVKGREAMEWLRKSARVILAQHTDGDDALITWVSPSGFPACQAYYAAEVHRINTKLHGDMKIRVHTELDEPDVNKHASGLAPNFVHSMDAAHLHLTTACCQSAGIDAVAMIHDDYGTHAANAQKLYEIIRERFVWMYENNDPIEEFHAKYPETPKPPTKGDLDIREVLKSRYFFS